MTRLRPPGHRKACRAAARRLETKVDATAHSGDQLARLKRVQARVRQLAALLPQFAGDLRAEFAQFAALADRHEQQQNDLRRRGLLLARDVLLEGRLFDAGVTGGAPTLPVVIKGLCPADLAERLRSHSSGVTMPSDLERAEAAAALAALDQGLAYRDPAASDETRRRIDAHVQSLVAQGIHIEFRWAIEVRRPDDWCELADPYSLDAGGLKSFSDAEYRAIALYRMGGLADAGAVRPIVLEPAKTGDKVRDLRA